MNRGYEKPFALKTAWKFSRILKIMKYAYSFFMLTQYVLTLKHNKCYVDVPYLVLTSEGP